MLGCRIRTSSCWIEKKERMILFMALITCPECGRENVSDSAKACPGCGFQIYDHFHGAEKSHDESNNHLRKDIKTMVICSNCGKSIKEELTLCPYCGAAMKKTAVKPSDVIELGKRVLGTVKKQISIKTIVIGIIVAAIIGALTSVVICESKIAKAKRLYAQGEYWKAYSQIDNIPTLGREELIRIETAAFAGGDYENYLVIKSIRLSSTSSKSKEAYQDAFWNLTFGLHIDLREINREPCQLNEIELDEYQKFVDLFYSELSSMFHMSNAEADKLMARFEELDELDEMKIAAYDWLDKNFF